MVVGILDVVMKWKQLQQVMQHVQMKLYKLATRALLYCDLLVALLTAYIQSHIR